MSVAVAAAAAAFTPEALATKALEKLGADAPTTDAILRLAAYLAELVNKAPGLRGSEKAALVQRVLRDIVNIPDVRAKLSDDTIAALNIVIDTVVPTALTLIISAGRGELDLRQQNAQAVASSLWSWCCTRGIAIAAAAAAPKAADTAPAATVAPASSPAPPVVATEVRIEEAAPAAAASSAPTESSATPVPALPAQ